MEEKHAAETGDMRKISGAKANDPKNLQHMNFWALNRADRLHRLQTYTKFLVVREPFERLLSAYRNKLQTLTQDSFGKISAKIHQRFSKSNKKDIGYVI